MEQRAAQVIWNHLVLRFPLTAIVVVDKQFLGDLAVPQPHATIIQVIIIIGVVTISVTKVYLSR